MKCAEENCLEGVKDFTRVALQAANGSMVVDVMLCELHIATLELSPSGSFLFLRQRTREDGFQR